MERDNREIYILESGILQEIGRNISKYSIKIKRKQINLPLEIEEKVQASWEKFENMKGEEAKDNSTYFFEAYDEVNACDYVFEGSFRYVQAFGRTKEFEKYAVLGAANNMTALSSLCLVLTADSKMILGVKKNMDSRISGFSGYISRQFIKENQVDLYAYISQSIMNEINIEEKDISGIIRIGQTYSHQIYDTQNKLNTKVYNNNFIINLTCTADKVLERFKQNFQFSELIVLECNEDNLNRFIIERQRELSIHCIGAIYNYLIATNNTDVAKHMINNLDCKIVVNTKLKKGTGDIGEVIKKLNLFNWGIIGGDQIGNYSVAPQMWRALFEYLNYPVNYFVVAEKQEKDVVDQLDELIGNGKLIGGNVAMPWKQLISNQCDEIDEEIKSLGTINTFVFSQGKLKGYNTDGKGLIEVIKKKTHMENKKVLIMGAGGACQTVPLYLIKNKVSDIYVYDVIEEKAKVLSDKYIMERDTHTIRAISYNDLEEVIKNVDIIINASPCGMQNYSLEIPFDKKILKDINEHVLLVEMVYNPYETLLLQSVKDTNPVCRGIDMLVEQAVQSFYHGFGIELNNASKKIMKEAAKSALISK